MRDEVKEVIRERLLRNDNDTVCFRHVRIYPGTKREPVLMHRRHMKKINVYEKVRLSLIGGRNLAQCKAMKKIYVKQLRGSIVVGSLFLLLHLINLV